MDVLCTWIKHCLLRPSDCKFHVLRVCEHLPKRLFFDLVMLISFIVIIFTPAQREVKIERDHACLGTPYNHCCKQVVAEQKIKLKKANMLLKCAGQGMCCPFLIPCAGGSKCRYKQRARRPPAH
eukprot:1159366-Pelagomonas_calceolata.AAC.2